jgi:hypothetical protein
MRTGAGPAIVAFVKPSTVGAVFCAVNAPNAMPVIPAGIAAAPTPFAIVTLEYTTGLAWLTHPMNNFCPVRTPEVVKVMDVGGEAGAVAFMIGEVRLRDGKMGRGSSCGQLRGSVNVRAML